MPKHLFLGDLALSHSNSLLVKTSGVSNRFSEITQITQQPREISSEWTDRKEQQQMKKRKGERNRQRATGGLGLRWFSSNDKQTINWSILPVCVCVCVCGKDQWAIRPAWGRSFPSHTHTHFRPSALRGPFYSQRATASWHPPLFRSPSNEAAHWQSTYMQRWGATLDLLDSPLDKRVCLCVGGVEAWTLK